MKAVCPSILFFNARENSSTVAYVAEVAFPQPVQNFEFGSTLAPQCVQYDPISANLYPQ